MVILTLDSESLREFNACHAPDSGRFCSTQGTGSAAFKAWFAGSKVVDAAGKPLRAYHGTSAEDFDAFNPENPRGWVPSLRTAWAGDVGTWFTAPSLHQGNYDDENAEFIAGDFALSGQPFDDGPVVPRARVIPAFLRIENPREYQDYEEFLDDLRDPPRMGDERPSGATRGARLRNALIRHGFDGLVIRNSMTDGDVDRDDWVAFFPAQIKSAIGNRGTWSSKSGKFAEANSCHTPAGSPQGGQFCSQSGATVRRWHLTNNPHFKVDPKRKPSLNRTFLSDLMVDEKDLPAGVFVTDGDGVEYWKHAHGYERPYVAELEGTLAPPMPGGARMAREDLMQGDVRTVRVLTLDEFAREHYGEMGWVEGYNTDLPFHKQPKFKNYTARSVADMTTAERRQWERQFKVYTRRKR